MKIIVSNHAMERMETRFPCYKKKIEKCVEKAWKNKDKINYSNGKNSKRDEAVYKLFNGFIFVFEPVKEGVVLTTVFKRIKTDGKILLEKNKVLLNKKHKVATNKECEKIIKNIIKKK